MIFWLKIQGGASWFLDFNSFRHIRTNQLLSLFGWLFVKYILQPSFKHNNPKRAFIRAKFCEVVDLQFARGHLKFLGQNSTCSLSTRLALFMSLTFNPALLWKSRFLFWSLQCTVIWRQLGQAGSATSRPISELVNSSWGIYEQASK